MNRNIPMLVRLSLALAVAVLLRSDAAPRPGIRSYQGACDASAVEVLGTEHLVVANDEDNCLRVYRRSQGGIPIASTDLSPFLQLDPKSPEADLEGAAQLGDLVFWITSHGRNRKGAERRSRHLLFATSFSQDLLEPIRLVGKPYSALLEDLLSAPQLRTFRLDAAAQRAPKAASALNIEGLTGTPDGRLLIGFRNPIPNRRALVVPLLNPTEIIQGRRARLGDPILLNLGGNGIRSMAAWRDGFLIVAGAVDDRGPSQLFRWKETDSQPVRLSAAPLTGINPEGIAITESPKGPELIFVSDDGMLAVGGRPCKTLRDPSLKRFRALVLPAREFGLPY